MEGYWKKAGNVHGKGARGAKRRNAHNIMGCSEEGVSSRLPSLWLERREKHERIDIRNSVATEPKRKGQKGFCAKITGAA